MDASGAIELLKQIISIPSFSKQEDKVADLITDVLKRYRFDVHRKGGVVQRISMKRNPRYYSMHTWIPCVLTELGIVILLRRL